MDASTLCTLIARRIDRAYYQLWGLSVHWMSPDYDTPENRAIVADVIANYDELAKEWEAEQVIIKKQQAYRSEADPIFVEWRALLEVLHPDANAKKQEWLDKRVEIQKRFE